MKSTKDFMLLENHKLKLCLYVGNDKLIYPAEKIYFSRLSTYFGYYQYLVPYALFTYNKMFSILKEDLFLFQQRQRPLRHILSEANKEDESNHCLTTKYLLLKQSSSNNGLKIRIIPPLRTPPQGLKNNLTI